MSLIRKPSAFSECGVYIMEALKKENEMLDFLRALGNMLLSYT